VEIILLWSRLSDSMTFTVGSRFSFFTICKNSWACSVIAAHSVRKWVTVSGLLQCWQRPS